MDVVTSNACSTSRPTRRAPSRRSTPTAPVHRRHRARQGCIAQVPAGPESLDGVCDRRRRVEPLSGNAARRGFEQVTILDRFEYFAASSQPETRKVAELFGARSIVLSCSCVGGRTRARAFSTSRRRRALRLAQLLVGMERRAARRDPSDAAAPRQVDDWALGLELLGDCLRCFDSDLVLRPP